MSALRPELERRLVTTETIRAGAERVGRDLASLATPQLAQSMRALTNRVVSELLPLLAADEEVMGDHLDADLAGALESEYREIRSLTERLTIVTENIERTHRRAPHAPLGDRCLRSLLAALETLGVHQRAAFARCEEILAAEDQERVTDALQHAAIGARERMMLIVAPSVPSTAATVLRKRPDLNAAFPVSLAEIERQ